MTHTEFLDENIRILKDLVELFELSKDYDNLETLAFSVQNAMDEMVFNIKRRKHRYEEEEL